MQVFGSSLDVLDIPERVEIKRAYVQAVCEGLMAESYADPCEAVVKIALDPLPAGWSLQEPVPVETWLTPKPECSDLPLVTVESYRQFLETDGCLIHSTRVASRVAGIVPERFVMIGVDHSQTGGAVRALARRYGARNLSVIVLDAHFDVNDHAAIRAAARWFGGDDGPADPVPPYACRFYHCGNFLGRLIEEGTLAPENLFVFGVADHPGDDPAALRAPELQDYVTTYFGYLEQGATVVPKQRIQRDLKAVEDTLRLVKTPYVYVSVDMDVGAYTSHCGVRFPETVGMSEEHILGTVRLIEDLIRRSGMTWVGADLMEMDVHFAGVYERDGRQDRTYDVAAQILRIIAEEER